jgi:hypothetical protein
MACKHCYGFRRELETRCCFCGFQSRKPKVASAEFVAERNCKAWLAERSREFSG